MAVRFFVMVPMHTDSKIALKWKTKTRNTALSEQFQYPITIDTLIHKYMAAHCPGLVHVLR